MRHAGGVVGWERGRWLEERIKTILVVVVHGACLGYWFNGTQNFGAQSCSYSITDFYDSVLLGKFVSVVIDPENVMYSPCVGCCGCMCLKDGGICLPEYLCQGV